MGDLTLKQEKFCQFYIETGNASASYRLSYDAENMSPDAIYQEASTLKEHPQVSLRIKELKEEHAKRHEVTVDSITLELEWARKLAHQVANPSAAVSATMGKAKIHGLIIDKGEHTGKDGQPLPPPTVINVAGDIIREEIKRLKDEF